MGSCLQTGECRKGAAYTFDVDEIGNPILVTKTADTDDGICDADCSLREAIDEANNAATDDVIEFASPLFDTAQTITLGGTQLEINNNGALTINGTGAKLLTIDANVQSRVFLISSATATINDLTITRGQVVDQGGGGIRSTLSNLTINNCVIDNNRTNNNNGGGIAAALGRLNIKNSTISNNVSANNYGGGIDRSGASLTIINSTISGNRSNDNGNGGGGGISSAGGAGNLRIFNSTITNNTAEGGGGGIFHVIGPVPQIRNTIIANNTAPAGPDISGTINSQGYNLIENTSDAIINGDTTGNITGQDPMLGLLTDNGGQTPTHQLLNGSPAIDTSDPTTFEPIDQRGIARPIDSDNNGTAIADIGAFEALSPTAANATISGRVSNGRRGLPRAIVQMQD